MQNNIIFESEKSFKDCYFKDTNRPAKYDFYLPDYNLLIEYDGEQHFHTGVGYFNNPERIKQTQERDKIKTEYAKQKDIKLIRIPY